MAGFSRLKRPEETKDPIMERMMPVRRMWTLQPAVMGPGVRGELVRQWGRWAGELTDRRYGEPLSCEWRLHSSLVRDLDSKHLRCRLAGGRDCTCAPGVQTSRAAKSDGSVVGGWSRRMRQCV